MRQSSSPQFSRRLSVRLVAFVGILLAASWGPLSQTLRLVEVCESGKTGAECSFRVVLSRACPFDHLQKKSHAPEKNSEKSTTERLLSTAPDTLESAQSIHFDLGSPPIAEVIAPESECADARGVPALEWRPDFLPVELLPARAPPIA